MLKRYSSTYDPSFIFASFFSFRLVSLSKSPTKPLDYGLMLNILQDFSPQASTRICGHLPRFLFLHWYRAHVPFSPTNPGNTFSCFRPRNKNISSLLCSARGLFQPRLGNAYTALKSLARFYPRKTIRAEHGCLHFETSAKANVPVAPHYTFYFPFPRIHWPAAKKQKKII